MTTIERLESRRLLSGSGESSIDIGGTRFFVQADVEHGKELWKSELDGSNQALVKDIYPGVPSSSPEWLTNVGGTLFFKAYNFDLGGEELWKSDGTADGTVRVKDIYPNLASSRPHDLHELNGKLIFLATTNGWADELFVSDGTSDGTAKIFPGGLPSTSVRNLIRGDGVAYFDYNAQRYSTDGTSAGTALVSGAMALPDGWAVVGDSVFFAYDDGVNGKELWKSDLDGTNAEMVKDIQTGDSNPRWLTALNGLLIFTAAGLNSSGSNYEPWVSDGTEAGTFQLKEIYSGSSASNPRDLQVFNNHVLFLGTSSYGTAPNLYTTDGTSAGTKALVPNQRDAKNFFIIGDTFYFELYNSGTDQTARWQTDGTAEGTTLLDRAAIFNRVLEVSGTDGNDDIQIDTVGGTTTVTVAGRDPLIFSDADYDSILVRALGGDDVVIVSASITKDAVIYGNRGAATLQGGSGNDTLKGNGNLDGGAGNDSISGGSGHDSILGGDGDDRIGSGDGNDTIDGGSGDDTITSGSGNDMIDGGPGLDTINGVEETSLPLTPQGEFALSGGVLTLTGTSGNDLIVISPRRGDPSKIQVTINSESHLYRRADVSSILIQAGDGDDLIKMNGVAISAKIFGEAGNDTIYGSQAADRIMGGDGDDWINGQGGNDVIYGDSGNDRLFGGDGRDYINTGSNGGDMVRGGEGVDRIIAMIGLDDVKGNAGDLIRLG